MSREGEPGHRGRTATALHLPYVYFAREKSARWELSDQSFADSVSKDQDPNYLLLLCAKPISKIAFL